MNVLLKNYDSVRHPGVSGLGRQLTLSVVLPMYNESDNLPALFKRLFPVLEALARDIAGRGGALDYEVVCVDDGSIDGTFAALKSLRAAHPELRLIALSRNFGKEVALAAGLRHARGDAVVIMDSDLQHPPEVIADLVSHWREGFDIVFGVRENGNNASWPRRKTSQAFHRAFAVLAQTQLPLGACDFRLLDRKAVDALNAMPERNRFNKGLYSWIGFRQIGVPFVVGDRRAGASGWSFIALWRFAIDAITSFSMIPLRFSSYFGGLISLAAIAYAAYELVRTLIYGGDIPGYPSLIVAIMFFAGVQLLSLGIIGEYLGRVFTEVKQRPLYIVAEAIGFEARGEITAAVATAISPAEATLAGDSV